MSTHLIMKVLVYVEAEDFQQQQFLLICDIWEDGPRAESDATLFTEAVSMSTGQLNW